MADYIATPICHIFNLSLLESVCPQAWREAKVIPLPKNSKAPTGPSFVAPWLLFSRVVRCHKKKDFWAKLQLAQNRAARLALGCTQRANINNMQVSLGSKWRREWLHHYLYFWEVLTFWMHRAACLNYWHTEQSMGGTQYYIEPWLHGTLFHIK